ncbi:MAG: AraC family transcriptional regulator [Firmicutes bacterium]|nr:AraC family transcriptional regulator [Bacillota bacterium]
MQTPCTRLTEDEMFRAMCAGDPAYDELFYTCVTSTGVFCVASCPARKPHRENIRFAHTRDQAIAWGFRACKRCRPDLEGGRRGYETDLVAQVQSLIDARLDQTNIAELASAVSLGPDHLMRLFRRRIGMTIREYIVRRRIASAREQLQVGEQSVLEIGLQVGFESPSTFYAAFSRLVGMPPGAYRQRTEQGAATDEVQGYVERG